MAELRAWVLAKLLWNPELDGDMLIREFLDGYYGTAGEHVYRYLETLTREARDKQFYASYKYTTQRWTYGPLAAVKATLISYPALHAAWEHLRKAEESVAGDAELLARVRYAQRPLLHVFRGRWDELKNAVTADAPWPMPESPEELRAQIAMRDPPYKDERFNQRARE